MENKKESFTPGPWNVGGSVISSGNKYIALCMRQPAVYGGIKAHTKDSSEDAPENREEVSANARLIASAPELLAALEMQEAAFSALSIAHHYQDSMEGAKDHGQKQYAKNAYLEAAKEADILQDKASEMRRAAIAKAKGE